MLLPSYQTELLEAGCDEAGRGCIAGPVYAAAVILPKDFSHPDLTDSKKLSEAKRNELRIIIESEALAWAVGSVSPEEIDRINILNASFEAMHRALDQLDPGAEFIAIDGNRFNPYKELPYATVIKGDGKLMNIAAASILAKTHRDEHMAGLHNEFPEYNWASNKGYPTIDHRNTVINIGASPHHRKTFKVRSPQIGLFSGNS